MVGMDRIDLTKFRCCWPKKNKKNQSFDSELREMPTYYYEPFPKDGELEEDNSKIYTIITKNGIEIHHENSQPSTDEEEYTKKRPSLSVPTSNYCYNIQKEERELFQRLQNELDVNEFKEEGELEECITFRNDY